MPAILAIDTAAQTCSAALLYQGQVTQLFSAEPRTHTRKLLPMVDELLTAANCELSALDAIAFTAGPGSFTGLRIGLGVVQGLAFGANLPVIPVSTLQAMACSAQRQLSLADEDVVVPALDARMSEIYWGAYAIAGDSVPTPLFDDRLTAPEFVAEGVAGQIIGAGEGWQYQQEINAQADSVALEIVPEAQDILTIAQQAYNDGKALPIDEVSLTYLRDEVSWKKRVKLRP